METQKKKKKKKIVLIHKIQHQINTVSQTASYISCERTVHC
eukprot:SAG11_NODE_14955_length_593_cov_1.809717_1_plen_40_part_10